MRKRLIRGREGVATPQTIGRRAGITAVIAVGAALGAATLPAFGNDAPTFPEFRPLSSVDFGEFVLPWREDLVAAARKLAGLQMVPPHRDVVLETAAAARRKFDESGFDLSTVGQGRSQVPRLYAASLPRDFHQPLDTEERKDLFVSILLPQVLRVNEEILADRARLIDYMEGAAPSRASAGLAIEPEWLSDLRARYEAEDDDLEGLLVRVDAIPPSLALAQGAQESGWGRSRFAVAGNALFGQWSFGEENGMTPRRRDSGRGHNIKKFATVYDAVRDYMMNLNTHPAYAQLRLARLAARRAGERVDGHRLASHLGRYAEDGAYVKQLRSIMRANALARFDAARLHVPSAPLYVEFRF